MNKQVGTRVATLIGVGLLTLSGGIFLASQGANGASLADEGVADAVQKIAAAIKNGENASARAQVEALVKKVADLEDVMNVLKLRTKKGLGVGKIPGQILPDGIELKLVALDREALNPAAMAKEGEALEEMAYVIAAVADITAAKPPGKFQGKQTRKDWISWSQDTRTGANELAWAARKRGGQEVKAAAGKINAACISCHEVFK